MINESGGVIIESVTLAVLTDLDPRVPASLRLQVSSSLSLGPSPAGTACPGGVTSYLNLRPAAEGHCH